MADGKAKPKYKPFPKVKEWKDKGKAPQNRPIDYEALRALYLAGPDYDWTPFCKRHGFNDRVNRDKWRVHHGVDFKDWKRQWLREQAGMHDDEIAPQVLELRKMISIKRIQHVDDWIKRSHYFKALLDGVLRKHGEALQHDQKHATMIARDEIAAKFTLDQDDLNTLASAAQRIQELESRALLIVSGKTDVLVPALAHDSDDASDPGTGDGSAPEFTVSTMGQAGLNAAESARLLASWFDQAPVTPQPEPPKPVEVPADEPSDSS